MRVECFRDAFVLLASKHEGTARTKLGGFTLSLVGP